MKVIKPGRKQRGWSKKFKCTGGGNSGGGCRAILLVSEYDIYYTYTNSLGETDSHKTFCCVSCGVETDVSANMTPKGTRPSEAVRERYAKQNPPHDNDTISGR